MHIEHLTKLTVYWDLNQISSDFKILIIQNIFSDHRGRKLEINYEKIIRKFSKVLELSSMLLNNLGSKKKSQNVLNWMFMEIWFIKTLEDTTEIMLRYKFITLNAKLREERPKISDLNVHFKIVEK